jgi:hypothetical protein
VSKVLARGRSTGETTARAPRNQITPKLAPLYDAIRARVAERPDETIEELHTNHLQKRSTADQLAATHTAKNDRPITSV